MLLSVTSPQPLRSYLFLSLLTEGSYVLIPLKTPISTDKISCIPLLNQVEIIEM